MAEGHVETLESNTVKLVILLFRKVSRKNVGNVQTKTTHPNRQFKSFEDRRRLVMKYKLLGTATFP